MLGLFYFYSMNIEDLYSIYKRHNSVCTDTRKIKPNDIYFALKGDNFDGNAFAVNAIDAGASYAVVDDISLKGKSDNIIYVEDSLRMLQKLANFHRKQLKYPIIGLTGSNGKTTTKELINVVLSSTYSVSATKGNLNNHIGVPLTLLDFGEDLDMGIVEMGANHQKEIEFLCSISEPDFGLITNFGKAHLEGFGGVEGVIKGKSELYDFLKANQKTAFINMDDPKQIKQIGDYPKVSTFGNSNSADCKVTHIGANPFVNIEYQNKTIESHLIGAYNHGNIAVAIAIGAYFNVSPDKIKSAIESYNPNNNRSEIIEKGSNKIILDAYNANPTSMMAALKSYLQLDADDKYIFLGDMFELGEDAPFEHQAIVDFVEEKFDSNIFFIGENFYKTKTQSSSNKFGKFEQLEAYLQQNSIKNATLLIKGSRGMALERILNNL